MEQERHEFNLSTGEMNAWIPASGQHPANHGHQAPSALMDFPEKDDDSI
jgi:hypothetical protein